MPARIRRGAVVATVLAVAPLVAAPAFASPETLKRSMSNLLMGPLDVPCGFYVGSRAIVDNIQDIEDTTAVRVFYFIPAFPWNWLIQTGSAALRTTAGLLELLPGLGLFFFDADLEPLFDPAENQDALVDVDTAALYVKFGVNYVD